MPTRQEIIDQLVEDLEEEIQETEEEVKIDRRKAQRIIGLALIANNLNEYYRGSRPILKRGKIVKLVDDKAIKKQFLKQAKIRNKQVNYIRVARRQANIYSNQLKKEGVKKANTKLKKRAKNILQGEKGYYRDKGKLFAAKEVDKRTNAIVFKVWRWGMYGGAKDPRSSHQQADGQIRPLEEMFYVDGQLVSEPREFGDPAEDINCHCGIEIVIRGAL